MTGLDIRGNKEKASTELVTWTTNISYSKVYFLPTLTCILYTLPLGSSPYTSFIIRVIHFSSATVAPISPKFHWLLMFHCPLASPPLWLFKSDYPVSPVIFLDHLLYMLGPTAKVRHLACSLASRSTLEVHSCELCPFARILSFFMTTKTQNSYCTYTIHLSP